MVSLFNTYILKKQLLILVLVLFYFNVSANNPNSQSVVITPNNGIWTVQLTISKEEANSALKQYYKDEDLKTLSEQVYEQYLNDYLKSKFDLLVDNKKVKLASDDITIENKDIEAHFILPNFPKNYHSITLYLPVFEENPSTTLNTQIIDSNKSISKVLNHSNHFKMVILNHDLEFTEYTDGFSTYRIYMIISGLVTLGLLFYFLMKKKQFKISKLKS